MTVGEFITKSIFPFDGGEIHLSGYYATHVSGDFKLNEHQEIKYVQHTEFSDHPFASPDNPIIAKLLENLGR